MNHRFSPWPCCLLAATLASAAFAADAITGEADTAHEELCAQEQVVAGTSYRLGLDIGGATWLAVVDEDLDGSYELSSSEEIA